MKNSLYFFCDVLNRKSYDRNAKPRVATTLFVHSLRLYNSSIMQRLVCQNFLNGAALELASQNDKHELS
jgi:hypothetical protein